MILVGQGRRLCPIFLILVAALALRSWHLTEPPWDYHNWRQTITLMVARDFARHGFPLLHPQVQWVSHNRPSDPSYFSAEFSIQSIGAAVLYKVFGESDTIARVVVIAFSLAGIWFLYDLLRRRAGPLAAFLGAFIYALLPYHVFFGRVFMPEIPAISLALGALDMLDRWTDRSQVEHPAGGRRAGLAGHPAEADGGVPLPACGVPGMAGTSCSSRWRQCLRWPGTFTPPP